MSLFSFVVDLKSATRELARIAAALERAYPPDPEPEAVKPEDAVTYVDEEVMAAREEVSAIEKEYERLRAEQEGTDPDIKSPGIMGVDW